MLLYRVKSSKSIAQLAQDFEPIAQKHGFGVLGMHDLKAKLNQKGVPLEHESLVYEVCNPQQAKKVLDAGPEIATALPCRVAMYPDGAGVTLATIRPTALIEMFQTPELKQVAAEVEQALVRIMDEAAG